MAKFKLRTIVDGSTIRWVTHTGQPVFAADGDKITIPAMRARVWLYGLRKGVADGAAGDANPARAMAERFDSMVDGTWGQRKYGAMAHGELFAALVKLGTPDTAERRETFATLSAGQIAKLYARPDVQAVLAADVDDDTADALAGFGIGAK